MDDLVTKLHDTTNAAVWAEEFLKVVGGAIPPSEDGGAAIDFGLMVGWFANAIETGRNAGRAQFREDMLAAVHSVYFGTCNVIPPESASGVQRYDGSSC